MELSVGMYVRLNCNYELGIGKIIRGIDEDNFIKAKFKDDFECPIPMYMISKASYKIIDLIEVGDYVNGYIVLDIIKDNLGKTFIECGCKDEITYDYVFDTFYNEDIKSIVTKEAFESMSYEVG